MVGYLVRPCPEPRKDFNDSAGTLLDDRGADACCCPSQIRNQELNLNAMATESLSEESSDEETGTDPQEASRLTNIVIIVARFGGQT
jgi:hypothetical protein